MIEQNDIIVESWEQLCEEVYRDSWKPEMGRYRSDYAFRGLSDKNYELKNSFLRNCGEKPELEYHLLRNFRKYSLQEILSDHINIAQKIIQEVKPLAFFNDYLKNGYYPYFIDDKVFYGETLLKHINLALEIDVTYLNQIDLQYLPKLRKLLQIIASQVPFSPNVSKVHEKCAHYQYAFFKWK